MIQTGVSGSYVMVKGIRIQLRIRMEQSLLFELIKALDLIEISPKWLIFPHACATGSELPSNISTMIACSNCLFLFLLVPCYL